MVIDNSRLAEQLNSTLLGRLRLKLFHSISNSTTIPDDDLVRDYLLKAYQQNYVSGELLVSTAIIDKLDSMDYDGLGVVSDARSMLHYLERSPLNERYFVELQQCPAPLPSVIGVFISCYELAGVSNGYVYSVYIVDEEHFPDGIIEYLEVRACDSDPYPFISLSRPDGHTVLDHDSYTAVLPAEIALKVLAHRIRRAQVQLRKKTQHNIVRASKLFRIAPNVSGRYLRQLSGKIELAVIVGEKTSAEELRGAWGKIDTARERLLELQGSDMLIPERALLHDFGQRHAHGWSCNTIAMDINYDCLVDLCQVMVEEKVDTNRGLADSPGFIGAWMLLKAVRMKDEDILGWLLPGLEAIRDNQAPWSPQSGPVDRQRVRDAIRQWERELKSGKVIVIRPPESHLVRLKSIGSQESQLVNEMAQSLLRKSYPNTLERYRSILSKTMSETGYAGVIHMFD